MYQEQDQMFVHKCENYNDIQKRIEFIAYFRETYIFKCRNQYDGICISVVKYNIITEFYETFRHKFSSRNNTI